MNKYSLNPAFHEKNCDPTVKSILSRNELNLYMAAIWQLHGDDSFPLLLLLLLLPPIENVSSAVPGLLIVFYRTLMTVGLSCCPSHFREQIPQSLCCTFAGRNYAVFCVLHSIHTILSIFFSPLTLELSFVMQQVATTGKNVQTYESHLKLSFVKKIFKS